VRHVESVNIFDFGYPANRELQQVLLPHCGMQHCIFCSSYGDWWCFLPRPDDYQVYHREMLRKVLELEPKVVEVQAGFEPLDPFLRHATLQLVTWLLDHGFTVKLFTHLIFPIEEISEFFEEIVRKVGARSIVEEKLQVHTSCHAVDPYVLSEIWTYDLRTVVRNFRTWLSNVWWLVNAGIYVGFHFVVTRLNINEIFKVYALACLLGARQLSFLRLAPQGLAERFWNYVAPTWIDWIRIYAKFLRLIRFITNLMFGDFTKYDILLNNIRDMFNYIRAVYGIEIPYVIDHPLPKPRFGCPINWFFIILDSPIIKEDDPYLKDALEVLGIYPPPKCVVVEGNHVCIDVGGYFPCIGMKDYSERCRTMQELDRTRIRIIRTYLSEECKSCPYFELCLGKCYAQKIAFGVKIDPLCRILKKYRDEIAKMSLNKYYNPLASRDINMALTIKKD